ncbi:flagellar basal-body rod protein FlgG [Tropicimonas sp. S265A]|uniref:flagellar basal-body rod protein FlgG n=1 Tax=Tropicimonas sp. S265A TaxID=3415134 RepID=UPI003C7AD2E3
MKALYIAATGMNAQQTRVEVISNNLANMGTTGYNTRRAEFSDLLYQQVKQPGTINASDGTVLPTGIQIGLGVRTAAVSVELAQGGLTQSGGDLDIAIDGNGFLEVALADGTAGFTRDGSLKRSAEGVIVTSDGYALQPEIVIPDDASRISINSEGEIFAYFRDRTEPEELGQIELATFPNAKGLEAIGGNLFLESNASGPPINATPGLDGLGTIRQGYLEGSSVDAVREITELIEAQRGYELNSKVMTAADQMMSATSQVR